MTSRRRPRAKSWALRLFVALSYALLASISWQLALVEVVEHHETASQQDCPDDDDEGSCDCGPILPLLSVVQPPGAAGLAGARR